jgi:ATP-dependent DNA helicase RecG
MIETWGRGIERITTACKDASKREPLFEASSSEIKVTFFTDANIGENIGENIGDSIGVNETAQKIIELMRKAPTISAKAIAAEIGIARRNVETNISILKKAVLVERIGPGKRWALGRAVAKITFYKRGGTSAFLAVRTR